MLNETARPVMFAKPRSLAARRSATHRDATYVAEPGQLAGGMYLLAVCEYVHMYPESLASRPRGWKAVMGTDDSHTTDTTARAAAGAAVAVAEAT